MKPFRAVIPTVLPFFALVALCSATYAEPSEFAAPTDVGGTTPPTIRRAPSDDTTNAPSATINLSDGSVVKGVLCDEFLPAVSDNLGDIRLNLDIVKTIKFDREEQNGRARLDGPDGQKVSKCRISFRNGDLLTARIPEQVKALQIDTLVGTLSIPLELVASVMIARHANGGLIYHCTFDDEQSIVHPAAGPAGRYLGGEFVPGKVGNALLVKARTPAAEVPFPDGLMQPSGTIEFWAKIPGATRDMVYSDGGNPQFFAMSVGEYVNTFVKYTANDGFGTGGLHADLPGSAYVSSLPRWSGSSRYPDFLGDPAAWHHYALVWSEDGLSAASEALGRRVVSALYVDGRLVNPSYGTNGPDRAKFLQEFPNKSCVLCFPIVTGRQQSMENRMDFLIDEFKIWSSPKNTCIE